jgi:spore maturation protein CgeB
MRVLVAGDWHSDLHETEVCKSLSRLGHEALEFKWFQYFKFDTSKPRSWGALIKRVQSKFVAGPLIDRINRDFLAQVRKQQPDLIFVYRGTHITAQTLQTIRRELPSCKLIGYNNDDPFSPTQPRYLWRHFMAAIPVYDLMLAYRHANLEDLKRAGARRVDLMRSWYVPDRSYPVKLTEADKDLYECDVVFIGHYEPDQRLEYLEAIVSKGYKLRLFGPSNYWQKPLESSPLLSHLAPILLVWGGEYNKALCGAKIALCFFSKLNRDTYTRRCFEIPATQTMLLSEYSDDLATLYTAGVEADFFTTKDEMLIQLDYYINNSNIRRGLAKNGYEKTRAAGHDIDSRIREVLNLIFE